MYNIGTRFFRERDYILLQKTLTRSGRSIRLPQIPDLRKLQSPIDWETVKDFILPVIGALAGLFPATLMVFSFALALQPRIPFHVGVTGATVILALLIYGFVRISQIKK